MPRAGASPSGTGRRASAPCGRRAAARPRRVPWPDSSTRDTMLAMDAAPPPEAPPLADPAYRVFDRTAWAALRASTPLSLTRADIASLKGLNETVSLADVQEIYLPL